MGFGASGSPGAAWVNSESWDLCSVMANTVSTGCRQEYRRLRMHVYRAEITIVTYPLGVGKLYIRMV